MLKQLLRCAVCATVSFIVESSGSPASERCEQVVFTWGGNQVLLLACALNQSCSHLSKDEYIAGVTAAIATSSRRTKYQICAIEL